MSLGGGHSFYDLQAAVKHPKYRKYYDLEASKTKKYKYLTKVCTQMINCKHCKLCTVHILQITEQIIVLFLVKVKCCKLSSNLETTKPKEARISKKVILKRHHLSLFFTTPLLLCTISWTQVFAQMIDFKLDVQITDQIVVFIFFEQTNVENTTLMLN